MRPQIQATTKHPFTDPREKLILLYQELHELTEPVCANQHGDGCRVPRSCCEDIVCLQMIDDAKRHWDVTLEPTGHDRYSLMGPEGCIAKPHERGLCVMHVCCINNLGYKPGDPEWTEHYFVLREQIEEIQWALWERTELKAFCHDLR